MIAKIEPPDSPLRRVLAIMPTYNECENIRLAIERVLASDDRVSLLIVDDASPDGTGKIVEEIQAMNPRIALMRRAGKMGLGTAYVAGFKYAIEHDYDAIIEIDADLSHNPSDIPRLLKAAEDSHFVIGSRYVRGVNVINWPLQRLILSYAASTYSRFVTGMPYTDQTAGFAVIRLEVLKEINLDRIRSNGYSFQIEIKFKAHCRGFKIVEVPIVFTERSQGSSKMNRKIVFEAIWRVWRLRIGAVFGRML
ncbi:undecaprenyl-phosphate mannosyltransferase [bacterium BMS3Bbin04]|nr:undecaprenyl-phosphate mannosyltransferase [bacterium BMS3Bbin04]